MPANLCKFCRLEIDEKAIVCPHCRKRQAMPLYVWVSILVVVGIGSVITASLIVGNASNDLGDRIRQSNESLLRLKETNEQVRKASNPPPAPEVTRTGKWRKVIAFKGAGAKTTETFHTKSGYWRINWSTWPGEYGDFNFVVMAYSRGGALESLVANIIGKGSDTSYMRGSGDYYLTVNTAQPYEIIVEEQE